MSVQYLSDKNGLITAVQIPINEWELIKGKFPDIDSATSLPEWQKELIDMRLAAINTNPKRVKPIEGLIEELDRVED